MGGCWEGNGYQVEGGCCHGCLGGDSEPGDSGDGQESGND